MNGIIAKTLIVVSVAVGWSNLCQLTPAQAIDLPSAVSKAFGNPDQLIMYKLSPTQPAQVTGHHIFCGYSIIQTVRIRPEQAKQICSLIQSSIGKGDSFFCFEPEIGLVIVQGHSKVKAVISARCEHIRIYSSGGGTVDSTFRDESKRLMPILKNQIASMSG